MALRKNKKLRFTTANEKNVNIENETNGSQTVVGRISKEKEQSRQIEEVPANERQQNGERSQIPSSQRRDQSCRTNEVLATERQQVGETDQISPNLRHNNPRPKTGGSSRGNDGQIYEYTVEDTNGKRRRGKTVLADIWNLPEGHRIVVGVNKENQPIGDEGGVLGYFCGTIARNGSLCPLTYTRWDLLKKGSNKNNEKMILKEVERRFLYPRSLEKWILESIGHKWRDYKCYLKGKGYDDTSNITTLYDNCPEEDVEHNQWGSLVNFWRSDEGQKRSRLGKESHAKAKVKPIHTTGTKSHARVREEMKKELTKSPSRTQVYLRCHQHESEAELTNQIKDVEAEQGDQVVDLDHDPVSKVLGKDQYGRVRGLGLGVKPSNVERSSYPRFCKGLNMSSSDEGVIIHYIRRLEGQVQRLSNRSKRQGKTITKLKNKLQDYDMAISSDSETDDDSMSSESNDSNMDEEYDDLHMDKVNP